MPPPAGITVLSTPAKSLPVAKDVVAPAGITVLGKIPTKPIAGTVSPVISQLSENAAAPKVETKMFAVDHALQNGEISADSKDWMYENKDRLTPEEFDHSLNVFKGTAEGQGFLNTNEYYFDQAGIPQPIKLGEAAPAYAMTHNVWGTQAQAEDDTGITTLAKHLWNGVISVLELPTQLGSAIEGLIIPENVRKQAPVNVEEVNNWLKTGIDHLKFSTSTESEQPFISFKKDEKGNVSTVTNFSMDKFAGAIGDTAAFILKMIAGGAIAKGVEGTVAAGEALTGAGEAASLATKIAPFAKSTALFSTLAFNDTYDQAQTAGLTGAERSSVAIVSALGQGMLQALLFPEFKAPIPKAIQEGISSDAVNAFINSSKKGLTDAALKDAYSATLESTAKYLPAITKSVSKAAAGMAGSQFIDNAVNEAADRISGRPVRKGTFSGDAFLEYVNSALMGSALGLFGAKNEKVKADQDIQQGKMAYAYLKDGRSADLVHNIKSLRNNGVISEADYTNALTRVNAYSRYFKETSDIPVDDASREQAFELTWKDEIVKNKMGTLEADETITPAIKEAKLKSLKDQSKNYVDQISGLLYPVKEEKAAEVVKSESAAPVEEKVAPETVSSVSEKQPEKTISSVPAEMIITKSDDKVARAKKIKDITIHAIKSNPALHGYEHFEQNTVEASKLVGGDTAEQKHVRNQLKPGDVLDVKLIDTPFEKSRSTGKKETYHHALNVYSGEDQVGSIKYRNDATGGLTYQDKQISRLLQEGNDVKLVVTEANPREFTRKGGKTRKYGEGTHEIYYQIVSKKPEAEYIPTENVAERLRNEAVMREIHKSELEQVRITPEDRKPVAKKEGWLGSHKNYFFKTDETGKVSFTTKEGKALNNIKSRELATDKFLKDNQAVHSWISTHADNDTLVGITENLRDWFLSKAEEPVEAEKGAHEIIVEKLYHLLKVDKFKTGQLKGEITDVKRGRYENEKGGVDFDKWIHDDLSQEPEMSGYDESELKDMVYEAINDHPDGITNKEMEESRSQAGIKEINRRLDFEEKTGLHLNDETIFTLSQKLSEYETGLEAEYEDATGETFTAAGGRNGEFGEAYYPTEEEIAQLPGGEKEPVKQFDPNADPMDLLKDISSEDELHRLLDFVDANKKGSSEFYNAAIRKQNELISNLKYQSSEGGAKEPLASSNSDLHQHIVESLKKKYPNVKVFDSSEEFQKFLDKSFPGEKLDLSKIGAAIANAVYIDPLRARQSTPLHEFAHVYWDMLPDSDPVKKKLLEFYPDEEAAISAIGNLGTDATKIKFEGSKLSNFLRAVRGFFAKVKQLLFPKSLSKEQQAEEFAKIMADRVWQNAEAVDAIQGGEAGPMKYMSDDSNERQQSGVRMIQSIADEFDFDPEKHEYKLKGTEQVFPSVTQIIDNDPYYKYEGPKMDDSNRNRGKGIHSIVESLIKGEDIADALKKSKLDITPEALKSLQQQAIPVIESLKKTGQILPESVLANSEFKVAGTSDMPILRKNGVLDIYDWKTSKTSTAEAKYEKSQRVGKASKKELQAAQLATYGRIMELADPNLGNEGMQIGDIGVIPVHYEVDANGRITKVTVEKQIKFDYDEYRYEADRLLNDHRNVMQDYDYNVLQDMTELEEDKFVREMDMPMNEMKSELKEIEALPYEMRDRERADDLKKAIRLTEDRYQNYRRDFKKIKDVVGTKDFTRWSYEQLVDAYNTLMSYGNMQDNVYVKRILNTMADRMKSMQESAIGEGPKGEKDISKSQVWTMAPSDIRDENPVAQKMISSYLPARESGDRAIRNMNESVDKLTQAVIKEKGFDVASVFGNKKKMAEVFKNLVDTTDKDRPQFKNPDDAKQAATLTYNEKKLLIHIRENMNQFKEKQAKSARGWRDGFYPQVSRNFWETYQNEGLFGAMVEKLHKNDPEALKDQKIDVPNTNGKGTVKMTYGDVLSMLEKEKTSGKIKEALAANKLKRYHKAAVDAYVKGGGKIDQREISKYFVSNTGELMTKFEKELPEGKEYSLDPIRAYKDYMSDMLHVQHMQPVLPELTAARLYYSKEHVNMTKFLDMLRDGDILGKRYEGGLGKNVDFFARLMVGWTYVTQMTYNLRAGLLNAFTGKWSQFRAYGIKHLVEGEARYWGDQKKAFAVLRKYNVVKKDAGIEQESNYSAKNFFSKASTAFTTAGEHWIRGAAFLAKLTPEEWANYDEKGNPIDGKGLSSKRIVEIEKSVEDVQGKYGFRDKRMYKHMALMRAGMQYKGWMPDFLKDRFGAEYTDAFGKKHKGSYRSLPYILRDVGMIMTDLGNAKKTDNVDIQNNKKNIREFLSFMAIVGTYSMVNGDSEQKKRGSLLLGAMGQMAGVFNLDSWTFLASHPNPSLATINNVLDASGHLLSTYQQAGKYGKKGDWMFPSKIMNSLPYNHLYRDVYSAVK